MAGQDAALRRGYRLSASVGSFAMNADDAALLLGRWLLADSGAFVMTGRAATLRTGSVSDIIPQYGEAATTTVSAPTYAVSIATSGASVSVMSSGASATVEES